MFPTLTAQRRRSLAAVAAAISTAALLAGCGDSGDPGDSEPTTSSQNSAAAEISEMLNAPVEADTSTSSKPTTSRSTASSAQRSAEPPIDRRAIDPDNDASGQRGRDDNLGICYHNSTDWQWLQAPGGVVPGGMIHNATTDTECSTGFLASKGDRLFIITAGHCGLVGDDFYVKDSNGNWTRAGTMVESLWQQDRRTTEFGADIGLIELSGESQYSSSLPLDRPLQGWITPQEAQRQGMAICRLGATTGYSCGEFTEIGHDGQFYFRNISDRGDSGGAIFAVNNQGAWALGVTSNGSDTNKTMLGGMEIAGAIEHWGLTLHT